MKKQALLTLAIDASIEAGKAIMDIYQQKNIEVELKSDHTPVTLADTTAHNLIKKQLESTPIPILSEEGTHEDYNIRKNWERFWIVDPLDGTKEFLNRNGEFTVNIALIEEGKPTLGVIYAPVLDVLYWGTTEEGAFRKKGIEGKKEILKGETVENQKTRVVASRSYRDAMTDSFIEKLEGEVALVSKGSSLKLCMIAEGEAEIYPRFVHLKEWDIAAGMAIVEASGGTMEQTDGSSIFFNQESLNAPFFIAKRRGYKHKTQLQ